MQFPIIFFDQTLTFLNYSDISTISSNFRIKTTLNLNHFEDRSWALVWAPRIFTLCPTARSFEQRAASRGYLLNINLLTNLLANTWSKPEGRKKRQRGNKKPGRQKAPGTFNGTLESKFSTKLKFSSEQLAVVCGTGIFITIILFLSLNSNSSAVL